MAAIEKVGENKFRINFGINDVVDCEIVELDQFSLPPSKDLVFGISFSVSPVSGAPSRNQIYELCICGEGNASIVIFPPIQNVGGFFNLKKVSGRVRGRGGQSGVSVPRSLRNLVMNRNHTLVGRTISVVRDEFKALGMEVQAGLVEDHGKNLCELKQHHRSSRDENTILELLSQAFWCRKVYLNENEKEKDATKSRKLKIQ